MSSLEISLIRKVLVGFLAAAAAVVVEVWGQTAKCSAFCFEVFTS